MELITIAFFVGVVVLLAVCVASVAIIKSDTYGESRPTQLSRAAVAQDSPARAHELVNS